MDDTRAHREWARRPADERFPTLEALRADAEADKHASREIEVDGASLSVQSLGDAIWIRSGDKGAPLTDWSFGQACRLGGAPAGYLQSLTTGTAVAALNESLSETRASRDALKLLVRNGHVAAMNGPRYGRVYDADVLRMLDGLQGFAPPPAYERNGSTNAGLYRGQRDMFVFMVNEESRIEDGSAEGLGRGFFLWNSEVGARSFGIATFLYRHICGNHIVWGMTSLVEKRLKHIGEVSHRARAEVALALSAWTNDGVSDLEAQIQIARVKVLGKDKEEVVRSVVKATGATQSVVSAAWEGASQWAEVDGAPDTVWGMVNAITRYSQASTWTSDRVETDRLAGQLLYATLS